MWYRITFLIFLSWLACTSAGVFDPEFEFVEDDMAFLAPEDFMVEDGPWGQFSNDFEDLRRKKKKSNSKT